MSISFGIASLSTFVNCYQDSGESACTTRASGLVIYSLTSFVFEPGSTSSLASEETLWLAEGIFPEEAAAPLGSIRSVPIA